MLKNILLLLGCFLAGFHNLVTSLSLNVQFGFFLVGILTLGVPHGAADLLVGSQNAAATAKRFSKVKFLFTYVSVLLCFALVMYFFPLTGNLLFILFAAYHFGETDLYRFKTNTLLGKLFVIAYGLLILSVILMHHFEEVKPLLYYFKTANDYDILITWLDNNRYNIISGSGILFFATSFIYFLNNDAIEVSTTGNFLLHLAAILIILFFLPMLLGFSFYFVMWHSVLSLKNIIGYLKNNALSQQHINKDIITYSILAIGGLSIIGFFGFAFLNMDSIVGYLFLGLAVLTAPHMQIMHDMYKQLRRM
jgi:beta-carotene 15,15'-dioxygenase